MSVLRSDKTTTRVTVMANSRKHSAYNSKSSRAFMDWLADLKYIAARLTRRYLVPKWALSLLPGYMASQNEIEPANIVEKYLYYLDFLRINIDKARVLEIGVGATNSTGYELATCTTINSWYGYEPFSDLNHSLDRHILNLVANRSGIKVEEISSRTWRFDQLDDLQPASIDVILSHCVLEHVRQPERLLKSLSRLLKKGGSMIHVVDYRDHYFKYPFHFLKFSEKVWKRWLDPGDLPRYRLFDHIDIIKGLGFGVEVIEIRIDLEKFSLVEPWVRPKFRRGIPEDAAEWAVLAVTSVSRLED
jgi:SAM-dependent methyltransferase